MSAAEKSEAEKRLEEAGIDILALSTITGISLRTLRDIITGKVRPDKRHKAAIDSIVGGVFDLDKLISVKPEAVKFERNKLPDDMEMLLVPTQDIRVGDLVAYRKGSWAEVLSMTQSQPMCGVEFKGIDKEIALRTGTLHRIARKRGA